MNENRMEIEIRGRRLTVQQFRHAQSAEVYLVARDGQSYRYWRLEDATASVVGSVVARLAESKLREAEEEARRRQELRKAAVTDTLEYRARQHPDGWIAPGEEASPENPKGRPLAVEVPTRQINDSEGNIGAPYRVLDTLAAMLRRGTITDMQHAAGESFQADFARAQYDQLKAPALLRVTGGGGERVVSDAAVAGRDAVADALQAVGGFGSLAGSCCWWVLGMGDTIQAWCVRQGMGRRTIRPDHASGILVGALSALEAHYSGRRKRRAD